MVGANDGREWERCRREPAAASHRICSLFQQLPSRTCAHKANTGEQRYLAPAWPTNAMRDPRRGAATEMSRGEYATAMRETHLGRLLALPHRARSPTAPSAPKPDHALGRPHHRRARGFSMPSRGTPHEPSPWPAAAPPTYAQGRWARAAPSALLGAVKCPLGAHKAATGRTGGRKSLSTKFVDFRPEKRSFPESAISGTACLLAG